MSVYLPIAPFLVPRLVPISITNGPAFCGVVGAVARHEYTGRIEPWIMRSVTEEWKWRRWSKYFLPFAVCLPDTVIGPKVSLVARMITAYPGLVSCDEVTYLRSMLPAHNFKNCQRKLWKTSPAQGQCMNILAIEDVCEYHFVMVYSHFL
jgi:adenylate cyclase 10